MARIIREAIALLNRLIQLDRDAIEAYKTTMSRLGDSADLAQLTSFVSDHRRHVDELALMVRNLGGEPASQGHLHQALRRGRADLTGLSEAAAIVEALRRHEAEAVATYENAVSQPGIPVDVLAVLERGLGDERKHHAWVLGRVDMHRSVPRR